MKWPFALLCIGMSIMSASITAAIGAAPVLENGTYVLSGTRCQDAILDDTIRFDGEHFVSDRACWIMRRKQTASRMLSVADCNETSRGDEIRVNGPQSFSLGNATFQRCDEAKLSANLRKYVETHQKIANQITNHVPVHVKIYSLMGIQLGSRFSDIKSRFWQIFTRPGTGEVFAQNCTGGYCVEVSITGPHMGRHNGLIYAVALLSYPLRVRFSDNAIAMIVQRFGQPLSKGHFADQWTLGYGIPQTMLVTQPGAQVLLSRFAQPEIEAGKYPGLPNQVAIMHIFNSSDGYHLEGWIMLPKLGEENRNSIRAARWRQAQAAKRKERLSLKPKF